MMFTTHGRHMYCNQLHQTSAAFNSEIENFLDENKYSIYWHKDTLKGYANLEYEQESMAVWILN